MEMCHQPFNFKYPSVQHILLLSAFPLFIYFFFHSVSILCIASITYFFYTSIHGRNSLVYFVENGTVKEYTTNIA